MNLDRFFDAPDESALRHDAGPGERLELPCAVVHPACRAALRRALGLEAAQIEGVLFGGLALVQGEGGTLSAVTEAEFYALDPEGDFDRFTCADAFALHAPGLTLEHVPIEPERAAKVRAERLVRPFDEVDACYVDLLEHGGRLSRLLELGAPGILVRTAKAKLQQAFEGLVAARSGVPGPERWSGYELLMTGAPASPECQTPWSIFALRGPLDPGVPRDCFVLRSGLLVMFLWGSVVVGVDGELRDWFATCGLRPVGDDAASILFVSGGGPASGSRHFSPTPVVRDLRARRWVTGALPPGLPGYAAGTIADMRWAIVADLRRALGFHISPGSMSDQSGGAMTSVDNAYAYDGGPFVIEVASGRRVLDMRALVGEIVSFARCGDGAFRFIMAPSDEEDEEAEGDDRAEDSDEAGADGEAEGGDEAGANGEAGADGEAGGGDEASSEVQGGDEAGLRPLRIVDENGSVLCELPAGATAAALSPDGACVLWASPEELALVEIESGRRRLGFDLRPLAPTLALPPGAPGPDGWQTLLATFGVAECVAEQTLASARATLEEGFFNALDDSALASAIAGAAGCPKLSALRRLPKLG
jgi:hypothetical protein